MMAKKRRRATGPRASWKGNLKFGLVSFPVQAFNAHAREGDTVAFHQLHAECHSRIRYEKHCPLHGKVSNDEIVSGYEYAKGKYVEIDEDEIDALRTEKQRSLDIDTFVEVGEIDPIYFDGRMYYLAPNGAEAKEPYAIFLAALEHQDRWGVGQVVFSGKEQLAVLRPYEGALHMAMLNYVAEIRDVDEAVGDLPTMRRGDKKVLLAEKLIQSWGDGEFDLADYTDKYRENVLELIDAKVEGREVVEPEAEEAPEVINLMDALRQSVGRQQKRQPARRKPKVSAVKRHRSSRRRRAS
jgi:DNA end-binding protein Ku